MLSSKPISERALFAPFGAAESAVSFWRDMVRTSAGAALWWTERWIDAPKTLMALSPVRYGLLRTAAKPAPLAEPVAKPPAEVIDLAEAVASRAAADVAEMAETAVEIAETAFETPVSVAEDAGSVATVAAEEMVEAPIAVAAAVEAALPDDLTRLVGVGPKLAAALAQRGVTRFAQIAAWTADEIVELDKALDLKGRAVRDAWVAQAKRFSSGEAA